MAQHFFLKVYIDDTDYAGVVYHSNYLKFFERARSEWAESLGFGIPWQTGQGIFFPVHSLKVDYLKPARLNDSLEIVTVLLKASGASLVFLQELRSAKANDTILCRAEVKVACVDKQFRVCALPKPLIEAISIGEIA